MKIKELEELLSISRSNIRFYEKQGLFLPERQGNNYRDYTDKDIDALKKIIVFRKMGFTIEEIKLIQKNELSFEEAVNKAQLRLEEEIEQLNGSLNIVKQVSKEHSSFDEIDIPKYWDTITQSEKAGEKYINILKDYLGFELLLFDTMWKTVFFFNFKKARTKHGITFACILIISICLGRGLGSLLRHGSFWTGFLYPFELALTVTIVIFPLYLLSKKAPKLASIIADVFCILAILFFAALFLFILFCAIRSFFS